MSSSYSAMPSMSEHRVYMRTRSYTESRGSSSGDELAWSPIEQERKLEERSLLPSHSPKGGSRKSNGRRRITAKGCLIAAGAALSLFGTYSLGRSAAQRSAVASTSFRPVDKEETPFITKEQDAQPLNLSSPANARAAHFTLSGGYVRPSALRRVAEKTAMLYQVGYNVMYERLPALLLVEPEAPIPARPLRHFYSDAEGSVGPIWLRDILQDWPAEIQAHPDWAVYHEQQALRGLGLPGSPSKVHMWRLSKFKNLAMHQAAYASVPDAHWHVGADDDSFLFVENILRYLAMQDPAAVLYLGHGEKGTSHAESARHFDNGTIHWAHGGAGYVLSQGLLDKMLHSDPKHYTHGQGQHITLEEAGGDSSVGRAVEIMTNHAIRGPNSGRGLFFPDQLATLDFNEATWYTPILSLHHLTPNEIGGLRKFEARALSDLQRRFQGRRASPGVSAEGDVAEADAEGDFVRRCDVANGLLPHAMQAALDAYRASPTTAPNTLHMSAMVVSETSAVAQAAGDEQSCAQLCDQRPDCFAWQLGWPWRSDAVCLIDQPGTWRIPQAIKKKGEQVHWRETSRPLTETSDVKAGIRVDRIAAFLQHYDCHDFDRRTAADAALVVPRQEWYAPQA